VWQPHHKSRADLFVRFNRNGALMGFDNAFADRKPEAGVTGDSGTGLIDTVESLEKMRLIARWDSATGVVHAQSHLRAVCVNAHFDLLAGSIVLDRVGEQVVDDLLTNASVSPSMCTGL
jgi:hypothetical protein